MCTEPAGKIVTQDLVTYSTELHSLFGELDIYLFDQLLRGRFDRRHRVLDAGCGDGRNLVYLVQRGAECFGVDQDEAAIAAVRRLAAAHAPDLPDSNFRVADLTRLPFADGSMDAVICSAVLHFAADEAEWAAMVSDMWRVLAGGGLFFARLASNIGLESQLGHVPGRMRLPDGSMRFVVTEALLLAWTERLGGRLVDPIKTTNVQQMRAMTTWVVEKPS
jgi:SAM-dependent methyltransferase